MKNEPENPAIEEHFNKYHWNAHQRKIFRDLELHQKRQREAKDWLNYDDKTGVTL